MPTKDELRKINRNFVRGVPVRLSKDQLSKLSDVVKSSSDTLEMQRAKLRKVDAAKDVGFAARLRNQQKARTFKGKAQKLLKKVRTKASEFRKAVLRKLNKSKPKSKKTK